MYIQRCRHVPEHVLCLRICVCCVCMTCTYTPGHTHIHVRIQMSMYVEVWNIMACNLDVPDPNKQDQTPDVVRER